MANISAHFNSTNVSGPPQGDETSGLTIQESTAIGLGIFFILGTTVLVVVMLRKGKILHFFKRKKERTNTTEVAANPSVTGEKLSDSTTCVLTFQSKHMVMSTGKSVSAFKQYYKEIILNPNEVSREFKHLKDFSSRRKKSDMCIALHTQNTLKNRVTASVPYNRNLVTVFDDTNPYAPGTYINASYVDGHNRKNEYITTQLPFDGTQEEFWTMIYQQFAHIVVVLCNFCGNEDFTPFWMVSGASLYYKNIRVRLLKEIEGDITTTYEVQLQDIEGQDDVLKCTLTEYNLMKENIFSNIDSLLTVIKNVRQKRIELQKQNLPVIVVCRDGVEVSGLFIALSIALDQVEEDYIIDIPNIVRGIREFRPLFVNKEEQYKLCYDVMAKYLEHRAQAINSHGEGTGERKNNKGNLSLAS